MPSARAPRGPRRTQVDAVELLQVLRERRGLVPAQLVLGLIGGVRLDGFVPHGSTCAKSLDASTDELRPRLGPGDVRRVRRETGARPSLKRPPTSRARAAALPR